MKYSGPARRAVTKWDSEAAEKTRLVYCVRTYLICECVWPSQSYKLCQFHSKIHSLGSDPRTISYCLFDHLRSPFHPAVSLSESD